MDIDSALQLFLERDDIYMEETEGIHMDSTGGIELRSTEALSDYEIIQRQLTFFGELVATQVGEDFEPQKLQERSYKGAKVYLQSTSSSTAILVAVTPTLVIHNPRDGEFSHITAHSIGADIHLQMSLATLVGPFHAGPVYSTDIHLLDPHISLWTPIHSVFIRYSIQAGTGFEDAVKLNIMTLAKKYSLHATE